MANISIRYLNNLEQKLIQKQTKQNKIVTFQEVPQEWEDFVKLCRIKSGNQMKQFQPFDYQVKICKLMERHPVLKIVKSRQLGLTQAVVSKFLHRACLNPAYTAITFMKNQEDSSNIARRARVMLSSLSDYVKNESDNLGYMKLSAGGELFFKNSAKDGGRSYDSVSDFLFDEAAFSPNIESIYGSASSASAMVGDATTKIIISTPSAKFGWYWDRMIENNGDVNFEEVCQAVVNEELPPFYYWIDEAGHCKIIIHWKAHPIYSQRPDYLEYRQKQDGTSWEVILREYNLTFVDTEISIFNSDLVRLGASGSYEPERLENAIYYLGIDCANLGDDYTVAVVLKFLAGNYNIVSIYRKRKTTSQYDIYEIGKLIHKYQPSVIGIEVTGGTGQVYLEQLAAEFKGYNFEAIKTTGDSKPVMVDRLILALEKEVLKYPENCPIVEEMLVFRRKGNKLEAALGHHDDTLMATAFALAVSPFSAQSKNGLLIENLRTF